MNSIFSYDSPMMQILSYVGDLIILNIVYLLCCAPIVTMGAAQAGMYTAMRVLNDKEDDSSPLKAFFRGFRNGFGKITILWTALFLAFAAISAVGILAYAYGLPAWACIIPVCITGIFMTLTTAFHSRFDCKLLQLLRNSFLLLFAHPIRSLAAVAVIWAPLVLFLLMAKTFMFMTPVWGTIYYAAAFLFAELFLRKPFKTLVDHFNDQHKDENEDSQEEKESLKVFQDVPGK